MNSEKKDFLLKIILIFFRSQPYAFSVDGSSGELVAAGRSETETQHWIRGIRSRVWRCRQPQGKPGRMSVGTELTNES
jgi:hypothetical protein